MNATDGQQPVIGFASLRKGLYQVAQDDTKIGMIRGDYAAGFLAYDMDGLDLGAVFATPESAAAALGALGDKKLASTIERWVRDCQRAKA